MLRKSCPVMPTNDYHFIDRRRVEGDVKEVADILEDAMSLPRWWVQFISLCGSSSMASAK